jgi:hypothetical protein
MTGRGSVEPGEDRGSRAFRVTSEGPGRELEAQIVGGGGLGRRVRGGMTIDLAVATFHLTMMDNGPEKLRGIEPLRLHAADGEKDCYIQIYVACKDIWTRLSIVTYYKLSQNRLEARTVTAVVIDLACLRVRKRCFSPLSKRTSTRESGGE